MFEVLQGMETWQNVLGLLGTGTAIGLFFGKMYQKIMDPEPGELKRDIADSKKELTDIRGKMSTCAGERDQAQAKVKNFDTIREALFGEEDELWRLHPAAPPEGYAERLANSKPKIITVANLKGGVGKTTLTANLAAYFEQRWGKRVLAIDLDYQGSLSETLLISAGIDYDGSLADDFISGKKDGAELLQVAKSLHPRMPNTQLLPSKYDLTRTENRLMLNWLLKETDNDIRFNLGNVLLHPAVQERYDVILIDAPPRLSTAAVNALACSHHLIVPTIPDAMSAPAVTRFLRSINNFLPALNPALKLAGVAVNLASSATLKEKEIESLDKLTDEFAMQGVNGHIYEQHIPRLAALANVAGRDVLYLKEKLFREGVMEKLGAEIAKSIGFGVLK